MMPHLFRLTILFACAVSISACLPAKQFYWGSYEDSLYSRQQHAGANGEAEATSMLLTTINEAQSDNGKVGPGIQQLGDVLGHIGSAYAGAALEFG